MVFMKVDRWTEDDEKVLAVRAMSVRVEVMKAVRLGREMERCKVLMGN